MASFVLFLIRGDVNRSGDGMLGVWKKKTDCWNSGETQTRKNPSFGNKRLISSSGIDRE